MGEKGQKNCTYRQLIKKKPSIMFATSSTDTSGNSDKSPVGIKKHNENRDKKAQ